MDEKCFVRSHYETKTADLKDEQGCVLTAVERNGKAVVQAFNMVKPKNEDILNGKLYT